METGTSGSPHGGPWSGLRGDQSPCLVNVSGSYTLCSGIGPRAVTSTGVVAVVHLLDPVGFRAKAVRALHGKPLLWEVAPALEAISPNSVCR